MQGRVTTGQYTNGKKRLYSTKENFKQARCFFSIPERRVKGKNFNFFSH